MMRIQKISLLLVLLLTVLFAHAEVVVEDGIHYRTVGESTDQLEVYKPDGVTYEGDVIILSEVQVPGGATLPVVAIAESAFQDATGLKSIKIPASVTTIGKDAFKGCTSLIKAEFASVKALCAIDFFNIDANPLYQSKSLYIAGSPKTQVLEDDLKGVTEIKSYAFAGGTQIKLIQIPIAVNRIGKDAFHSCKDYQLEYVNVAQMLDIEYGEGVSNPMGNAKSVDVQYGSLASGEIDITHDVNPYAFKGAKWLKKVNILPGVTGVGKYAFNSSAVESVTFMPGTKAEIFEGAFQSCKQLKSVVIPSVIAISKNVFKDCSELASITLPTTLEAIGEGAFQGCKKLGTITIPSSVTSILNNTFAGCTSLTQAVVQSTTLVVLPEGMFSGCTSLTTVTLPSCTQTIGKKAFKDCTSLTGLPSGSGILTIGENAFEGCSGIKSLEIPANINIISQAAFSQCGSLTDLMIAARGDLLRMESKAFSGAANLNIYSYSSIVPKAEDDTFDGYSLVQLYCEDGWLTDYRNASPWSGFDATSFTKKTITYFVDGKQYEEPKEQYVGKETPAVDAEPTKDGWVFAGWNETIPPFMPNEDLVINGHFTKEMIAGGVKYFLRSDTKEARVIGNDNPVEVTINPTIVHEDSTYTIISIADRAFKGAGKLTKADLSKLPKSTTVGESLFAECPLLKNVTLPETLEAITDSMFYHCVALESLAIPATVTSIGGSAFQNCTVLASIAIPTGVTKIGEWAFSRSGLKEVSLPENLSEMGGSVFKSCSFLTKATFAADMTLATLPQSTFEDCGLLETFTLPASTKEIGERAFYNCDALTALELADVESIGISAFDNCSNLKTITLPPTISHILKNAFSYCTKVEKITINSEEAPTVGLTPFSTQTYETASLYVKDVAKYKDQPVWKEFQKLYPIDPLDLKAEELVITLSDTTYVYDGTEKLPEVTVQWKKGEEVIPIAAEEYQVVYADSLNVGTATVTIIDQPGCNYNIIGSAKATYKITPKTVGLAELIDKHPQAAADKITYNTQPQNLIKAGIVKEGIKGTLKYSLDNETFAADIPQGTDAKKYTVYYSMDDDPNYTVSDTLSVEVTILPRDISVSSITLNPSSCVYDGTPQEPAVATVIVKYNNKNIEIGPNEYKVHYENNINATSKLSKAQVLLTDSVGGNFVLAKYSTTFEILPGKGKLDSLLTEKPIAFDTLAYTGEAQNLIKAGIINEVKAPKGNLKYSLDNKTFAIDIPQGTKAQEYTIYYKVEDDPNYTASDTLSLKVSIKAQAVALAVENITLEADSYTYDGKEKKPGVTVKMGETVIAAENYTVSYADNINAGTATATITAKADGNYSFEPVNKPFTIQPKTGLLKELIDKAPQSVGDNITYNTLPQNLIKNGTGTVKSGINAVVKYSLDKETFATDAPQGTDAQLYTIYYMVEGDPNYTATEIDSVKVTIKPREVSVATINLSESSFVYDGTAKEPAVSSVVVSYNNIVLDAKEYKVSYTNNINATSNNSKAQVIITDSIGGNFSFSNASKSFEIKPAKGTLEELLTLQPTAVDGLVYNGAAQTLIQAGAVNAEKAPKGKLKYSLDNKSFAVDIPQGTKAQEYTIYYKVEDDPNYTASDTLSLKVSIKAQAVALAAENITLEADSYVYDGKEKKPAVAVKMGETVIAAENYTVSYADNINAGTATVTVTAKADGNYSFDAVSKTYEITPAASSLTKVPTAKTGLVYNGNAQELLNNDGKTSTGTLLYSLSQEEASFAAAIPTGTDAKIYTVYYKVKGDANHLDTEVSSIDVIIAPKAITSISLAQSSFTYAGVEIQPDVTVEFNKQPIAAEEYTVTYADNINVGTATVTVTDVEGGNFTVSGSKMFTITKAPLTISVGSYEVFENEAIPEFIVNYNGFVNDETEEVLTKKPIVRCVAIAGSKAGDYTINVSGAEAANYAITHKNGKLTIMAQKFVVGGDTPLDEDDPATYQITSMGTDAGTTPTVAIVDDKDVGGAFAIPEEITYHDRTFTVTEIAVSTFENNKNLSDITIPSTITLIGAKAFKGCSNLKSIMVYIDKPLVLTDVVTRGDGTSVDGTSVFDGVDKLSCLLYVPDGSVELYKAAPVWRDFKFILPISTLTGISGGYLTFDQPFDIYNLQGIKVKSEATDLRGLPRGVYIINGKRYAVK